MFFSENAHVLLSRTGFVRNLGMHFSKYRLKGRYESFAPLMVSSSNKAKRHGLSFDVASQPALPYVTTGSRLPWPGPHVPNNSTSPIFFNTNQWDFSRESEGNSSPPVVLFFPSSQSGGIWISRDFLLRALPPDSCEVLDFCGASSGFAPWALISVRFLWVFQMENNDRLIQLMFWRRKEKHNNNNNNNNGFEMYWQNKSNKC